jgi:hypothetical protein
LYGAILDLTHHSSITFGAVMGRQGAQHGPDGAAGDAHHGAQVGHRGAGAAHHAQRLINRDDELGELIERGQVWVLWSQRLTDAVALSVDESSNARSAGR